MPSILASGPSSQHDQVHTDSRAHEKVKSISTQNNTGTVLSTTAQDNENGCTYCWYTLNSSIVCDFSEVRAYGLIRNLRKLNSQPLLQTNCIWITLTVFTVYSVGRCLQSIVLVGVCSDCILLTVTAEVVKAMPGEAYKPLLITWNKQIMWNVALTPNGFCFSIYIFFYDF